MQFEGQSKTKESKYNATVSFITSIGMLLLALMVFDVASMPAFAKVFMALWIFMVIAQGYQAYRNSIFSKQSLHQQVTDHDLHLTGNPEPSKPTQQLCHAEKLRKVEQLYQEGLLTKDEYLAKRKDILDEDWGS